MAIQEETIQRLVKKFEHHPGAFNFIYATVATLVECDRREIKSFVKRTFLQNEFDELNSDTLYSLSKHWSNVALTKKEMGDEINYKFSNVTSKWFRRVADKMKEYNL
jgi:hypothetical protein